MKTAKLILLAAWSANLHILAANTSAGGYVAHEWGTFTSVRSADGVEMAWQPHITSELPSFVYDLNWPLGRTAGQSAFLGSKATLGMLQRMETPVIYFYTDDPQRVYVAVDFPKGVVTEWYPQDRVRREVDPLRPDQRPILNQLRWPEVEILDGDGPVGSNAAEGFPTDASGSHYFAARETAANPLRVTRPDGTVETEKFLFYRGVGSFHAPLRTAITGDGADALELTNEGSLPLRHLFVYEAKGGRARMSEAPGLNAGERAFVRLAREGEWLPLAEARSQIATQIRRALVAEGLFEAEAVAMVKTWDDSWFAETGTRVLYTLPRLWTDQILPLKLDPAPQELVRVMVGRAEVITPQVEFALLREFMRYAVGNAAEKSLAVENVLKLDLGRFAEPALRRVGLAGPAVPAYRQVWSQLAQAATRPTEKQATDSQTKPAKPLASR